MLAPCTRRAIVASVLLVLVPLVARAERVVALPPRVSAPAPQSLRDGLRASLAGGVAAAGHDAVGAGEIDRVLAQQPALAACVTDVCLRQVAEVLAARAIVRATVELIGSSNYTFHLELYDARAARVTSAIDDTCAVCTVREANEALSRAAASVGRSLGEPPKPAPAPTTAPAAAPVRATSSATPRSRLYLGLGASALVLGLGAVGGGAALIALDGTETGTVTLVGNVPVHDVRRTMIPGIVLTSAGGVLLAGAGLFFWRSAANRRR